MIYWPAKAPDEVEDFAFDWTSALEAGETITGHTATADGVTIDSDDISLDGKQLQVWLSGGTEGATATITGQIVTSGGRTFSELATLPIERSVVTLAQAKDYLGLFDNDRDAKITAMIPRARRWVEDHTGLVLSQRVITERLLPSYGAIRLSKGPLVSVDEIAYVDSAGADQTYVPRFWVGQSTIFPEAGGTWPSLTDNNAFEVTYTAGFAAGEVDERLIGAMLALIEGEFSEGYAYPQRAIDSADRCCAYLRAVVA